MQLSNLFKVVKQNKTPQAEASRGVEVGDIIRVTTDISHQFSKPLIVAKYKGTGDIKDPKSFEKVGKAQFNTFYNNYSQGQNEEAVFFVEPYGDE